MVNPLAKIHNTKKPILMPSSDFAKNVPIQLKSITPILFPLQTGPKSDVTASISSPV